MVTWHLICIFILSLVPILIGAKIKSKKNEDGTRNDKNFYIGNYIQVGAIISACFMIFADITQISYMFYIALGAVGLVYLITFIYIYIKFLKK